MPASDRPRIVVTFLVALVVWIVLVAVTGELNVASVVLGVLLSALLVWWGEKRRRVRGG